VGTTIGNAVKADLKVSHMPVVRVLPRPVKKSENFNYDLPSDSPIKPGQVNKKHSSLSIS